MIVFAPRWGFCCAAGVVWAAVLQGVALESSPAAELAIGAATVSITPDKPVALDGQFNTRISRGVDNPLTATAVALESRSGGKSLDHAILVSLDIVVIRSPILAPLRERLQGKLPGFDVRKLVLTPTHTHTAPVTEEGKYAIPAEGVMQPHQYVALLHDRLEEVITRAWQRRSPGGVSWALGHAVIGYNRRAVYADGTAKMYGSTSQADFRGIEGGENNGLEMLFFWTPDRQPLALGISVGCPSQEVEGRSTINADFWHDARQQIRAAVAADLPVLGWPDACGDISPHRMYRKAAEERMLKLRGVTYTQEVGRRIAREVQDVWELARGDVHADVPFAHRVVDLALPRRMVTDKELAEAQAQVAALEKAKDTSRKGLWHQAVIDRYRTQADEPTYPVEIHVLRIGDVALATNPFELFVDYGVQIRARSKALQTLVVQLTGRGTYLPTARAVAGGSYSAVVQSNQVGPEGGQILVDRTVEIINALFDDVKP